jgi:hypothetical protein
MKFKGTIVITDPCYLGCGNEKLNDNWWEESDYGERLEKFGFTNYITEGTLIGDWSWHTYETETKNIIGQFCADAGLVGVYLLEEILKLNPNFEQWAQEHSWCATIIKDFDGDVKYEYDEKNDDLFHIVGKGNINFETSF